MLNLEDFSKFKLSSQTSVIGGQKIVAMASGSKGSITYYYDDNTQETCNDDGNSDFFDVYL